MTARIDPGALATTLDPLLGRTDAVVIGPGLGLDDAARSVVDRVVLSHTGPVVVDADAITHFQGRPEALASAGGRRVLTPHPGELGRLIGVSASEVESDRFAALARAVDMTRSTVLLKGPHTLVGMPGLPPFIGRAGTSALATGGAGDVLAGVIGALVSSGLEAPTAAFVGAFVHARAAEIWAADSGADRGLLAHEIADLLPRALADLAGDPRCSTD
jgi:NAD(P)H-hydrate epimerase